jgi:cell division septation protein DedD
VSQGKGKSRAEGPGWFATLGGAAILIVLGFGVGLVAGAAWEEPELVMDHFAGRTTEVPLAAGDRFEEAPPEAESPPPPLGSASGSPAPARPAVTASRKLQGGHAIQVGAFGDRSGAEALVRELEEAGFPVYVLEDTGGSARFKVRVGPVAERARADALAARLKREHRLPTWILTPDNR